MRISIKYLSVLCAVLLTIFGHSDAADETVVVYCYSGQTSAYVTAYLKVLGYDAKSLKFGANTMIWNRIPAGKFVTASAVMDYDYVTGP